jgi:hypothetical protein
MMVDIRAMDASKSKFASGGSGHMDAVKNKAVVFFFFGSFYPTQVIVDHLI